MAMTDAMVEVDYSTFDFNDAVSSSNCNDSYNNYNSHQRQHQQQHDDNYDNHAASLRRHPLWLTEGHFVYHLHRYPDGRLGFVKDRHGDPVCSPR